MDNQAYTVAYGIWSCPREVFKLHCCFGISVAYAALTAIARTAHIDQMLSSLWRSTCFDLPSARVKCVSPHSAPSTYFKGEFYDILFYFGDFGFSKHTFQSLLKKIIKYLLHRHLLRGFQKSLEQHVVPLTS